MTKPSGKSPLAIWTRRLEGATDLGGVQRVLGTQGVLMECNIYSAIFDFRHNRLWLASGEVPAAKGGYREYPLFR
jgi:hypothetical protein